MNMFKDGLMEGKRILVSGGGTGLGRVMTEHYASLGATVYICGRRQAVLDETAKEITDNNPGTVIARACDIRSSGAVDEMVQGIFDEGPLDGLVNNAAGNFISRTKDLSPRGFDAIASIVFHGTFYMTHAVGTRWIELGHKGSVISILTTWVWTGSPYVVPSAMSKTAVHAMTMSLATEWAPHGIRLNAIAPGPFPTKGAWDRLNPGKGADGDFDGSSGGPMGRMGEMHELANLATFLMADGCEYLTGQTIAIDGAAYLSGGGTFSGLSKLGDDDWQGIRDMIKGANDQDKAQRTV